MSNQPLEFQADFTLRAQIQARAEHPEASGKIFLSQHERSWTYLQFRDESTRMAHFLLRRLGAIDDKRPGHVAMMLENHLELTSLYGGCGIAGLTLFGINTGLRGETLAGVINQSRSRILVVDERFLPEVERVKSELRDIPKENILVLRTGSESIPVGADLLACLADEVAPAGKSLDYPDANPQPDTNLMVIYTSGTTGLPKGINNNHFKLCATGIGISSNTEIGRNDVGYACMPLFHSNSMFVGLMPAFWVGGSMGLRERFSASNFLPDILKYGCTYWNYVGEPVHYVLASLESQYDGDFARIEREVGQNPQNKLRFAIGNGASPPDIDRFIDWLGLEDMYELYGSTEAAISTFRRKGDPRGSVGEVTDPAVKILNEKSEECPPAVLDGDGKISNYEDAVGEICRQAEETGLFQGYFDNESASSSKFRDGIYHSGDLGHMLIQNDKRYLYFDGRTDDWIRKDGENFSALQVARLISEHPDIPLAAAYGVPCMVSDELVMAAIKMRDGAEFDPQSLFDFCEKQIGGGSMDRKWFPDFVRIVDDFQYTGTQKILVRHLKATHYDRRRLADETIFWRERGDKNYRLLTTEDYERLHKDFEAAERAELLDR
ncbi:MAG: AMP-binding protein [bacterium]|nr:AMP-binding protein [bacterium]